VVLALVGGWERTAIAEMVGVTPGAVRVRLHRALARLRSSMEDDS
jgi:DNA-directed RNA polymerase specialized sigma24 family protein